MTENDYLNPADIKAQCETAISKIERDNEALGTAESSLDVFINDEEIKSDSFEALKQQISDYKTLIQAMQDANSSDAADFTVLKDSVGDEVLDGSNILTQQRIALQEKENDENTAREYERDAAAAEYPWEAAHYSLRAKWYWHMAEIDQKIYEEWKAKEEAFDAIEAGTKGLFQGSTQLRQIAQRGLESIFYAFQEGQYVTDVGAGWRTELVDCYVSRLIVMGDKGTATIYWTEVEKVLQKEASEITDAEYRALALVYLNADEKGTARVLGYCMDKKADVDMPWYREFTGRSPILINHDYSEWEVNGTKIGRIQAVILTEAESLLAQMGEVRDTNKKKYDLLKDERNEAIQRLTLISVTEEIGTFRGGYGSKYPAVEVTKGENSEIVMTFREERNIGSNYAPTISNMGESRVTVSYTTNGDSITMGVPEDAELAFKAYFCSYSAGKETVEFVYDEITGELISQGSEQIAQYVGGTLGKEALGTAIGAVPYVGDLAGFGMDIAMDMMEQDRALEFIEGQFDKVDKAIVYSHYDCSMNYVHYDTAENSGHTLYAYGGEKTDEKVAGMDALLREELGKGITKEDILKDPNGVYDLYKELIEKDIHNQDRYDEAINDK